MSWYKSRKFWVMLAGTALTLLGCLAYWWPTTWVTAIICCYLLGQGMADLGKEKAYMSGPTVQAIKNDIDRMEKAMVTALNSPSRWRP